MREQRGFVRLNVEAQVSFNIKGKSEDVKTVELEDISVGGIRIVSNDFLQSTDTLELTISIKTLENPIKAIGNVAWQRKIAENVFDTGIKFEAIDEDNKSRLENFIENIAGKIVERREYIRCDIDTNVKYFLIENPEVNSDCVGVDVSTSGLKILTKSKLEKGTKLHVEFTLPDTSEKIIATCTVVAWASEGENNLFETGIEFIAIKKEDQEKIKYYIQRKFNIEDKD